MCLECDGPLSVPFVYWHGAQPLLFHGECAEILGAALLKDSRECELAADPRPHWRRRAVATVRHRLRAEERSAA